MNFNIDKKEENIDKEETDKKVIQYSDNIETKKEENIIKSKYQNKNSIITNKKLRMFCEFCTKKKNIEELWYLNIDLLNQFVNIKGQIKNKLQNKLCSKHQRLARNMIIRARHIHLLPYIDY